MADNQAADTSAWSIDLNVVGVQPASAKFGGPVITKPGVYRGVITASSRFTSAKGFDTVSFKVRVDGGDFDGMEQGLILPGRPDADKDPTGAKWKARWKSFLLNVVKDPANLEKGTIKYGTATQNTPVGKNVYFYVRVPEEGELDKNGYPKKPEASFMAPAEAQAEMEAEKILASKKAGNGQASTTAAQTNGSKPAPAQAATQATAQAPAAATAAAGVDPLMDL